MITEIAITDLTRMYQGRVCIAGYNKDMECVRLVLPPPGISQDSIIENGKASVFPFAVVACDLLEHRSDPPHTEDHLFDPASLHLVRVVEPQRRERFLQRTVRTSVAEIFGQPVLEHPGHYVLEGQGDHSIGTVRPHAVSKIIYAEGEEGTWDYRISFKDAEQWYRLKITDLTWHYYCDCLRGQGREPDQIADELTAMLKRRSVYLRVGLSRGWRKFPGKCFLQVNGIHTFPDYLQGQTFVDLNCVKREIREAQQNYDPHSLYA
jgi:hypothetical protein